jgi:hypothetical protein
MGTEPSYGTVLYGTVLYCTVLYCSDRNALPRIVVKALDRYSCRQGEMMRHRGGMIHHHLQPFLRLHTQHTQQCITTVPRYSDTRLTGWLHGRNRQQTE